MSQEDNMPKEDEERLAEIFQALDRNKDGRIDIDDLSALLKSQKNVPNASEQAQFKQVTVNVILVFVVV